MLLRSLGTKRSRMWALVVASLGVAGGSWASCGRTYANLAALPYVTGVPLPGGCHRRGNKRVGPAPILLT